MATRKALAWAELKVGILIIVAIAILAAIVVLVLGVESPFADRYTLYTYLPNIGGLRPGTPVMLEGVTIGSVDSYEFAELDKGVRIKMRLQQKYQDRIRTDSIAKLRSLGLLGDKYIEISQGTRSGRILKENETVVGAPPLDLDQMIARATNSFDNLSDTVDNLKSITSGMQRGEGTMGRILKDERLYEQTTEMIGKMNRGEGTMGAFLNDRSLYRELNATAMNLRRVTEQVQNGEGLAGKLIADKELGDSLQSSVKKIEGLLVRIEKGEGSLGKLSSDPALYNNLTQLSQNLKPITEKIAKGEGSLGRLVHDKELYNNTNKFLSELVMLVHDVREDPKKYLRVKFSIF